MGIDRFTSGKTPDEHERPSRRADNSPDRPPVQRVNVTAFVAETRETLRVEKTIPLTEAQIVPVAGGRAIGGGTSNESLRRARKKQAKKG